MTALRDRDGMTPDSIVKHITEFATREARVSPRLRPSPIESPSGTDGAWYASTEIQYESFRSELKVRLFRVNAGWLVVSHWRLAREHNAKVWAINKRAMELVLRHLRFSAPLVNDQDYAPLIAASC